MKRLPMLLGFMALPGKALRILKRTRSEVGIWTRRWAADALGWTEGGAPALRQRDGLTLPPVIARPRAHPYRDAFRFPRRGAVAISPERRLPRLPSVPSGWLAMTFPEIARRRKAGARPTRRPIATPRSRAWTEVPQGDAKRYPRQGHKRKTELPYAGPARVFGFRLRRV